MRKRTREDKEGWEEKSAIREDEEKKAGREVRKDRKMDGKTDERKEMG